MLSGITKESRASIIKGPERFSPRIDRACSLPPYK
jgi:hypothetical protein